MTPPDRFFCSLLFVVAATILLADAGRAGKEKTSNQEGPMSCRKPVFVETGIYTLGSNNGQADERPARKVRIRGFQMDRCEVTRRRYFECIEKKGCSPPVKNKSSSDKKASPNLPITGVSFMQAMEFCRWEGKTLPTEDQWEAAARGKNGFRFPWGDTASCSKANYGSYDKQGPCGRINPGRPEEVGKRPQGKSPFGALDMGGNVWEWTRCSPSRKCGPKKAVLKGGSCCSMFLLPRSANRWEIDKQYRDFDIGFRCIKISERKGK